VQSRLIVRISALSKFAKSRDNSRATSGEMALIGAATIDFLVMLLAFWIGNRICPFCHAFGMGGTMCLKLLLFGYAAWVA
jgi:hypothetical protein